MPEALHRALHQRALEHGLRPGTKRYNAYVYGTLNKVDELHAQHAAKRTASETLRKKDE